MLTDDMVNEALLHVKKQLSQHRKSLAISPVMPLPTASHVMSPESLEHDRLQDCSHNWNVNPE